jgi:hypothetical protein
MLIPLTRARRQGRIGRFSTPVNASSHDVTVMLQAWSAGDMAAHALTRLAAFDSRKSQLAELHFFGRLSPCVVVDGAPW